MRQTDVYKLNLFDGADRFSRAPFNQNAEAVDAVLNEHASLISGRARITTGSYEGATASAVAPTYTDALGNTLSTVYGNIAESTRDIIIPVPFMPQLFFVSAYRSQAFSWSGSLMDSEGYYRTFSLSGKEWQAYQLKALPGAGFASGEFTQVRPFRGSYYEGSQFVTLSGTDASSVEPSDTDSRTAIQPCILPTSVDFSGDAVSGYNIIIRAVLPSGVTSYANERRSAHDIAGMTYHWVAIG